MNTIPRAAMSLTLAIAGFAGASIAPQAPPDRAGGALVAIDVSVVDQTGRPVGGLEAGSFTITVDGRPRRLASVQFISQEQGRGGGRAVLVVVDQGNIGPASSRIVPETVQRLLSRLGPADRAALAVIPGGMAVDFTRQHAVVREAVGKTFGATVPPGRSRRVGITEALAIGRNAPGLLQQIVTRDCGAPGSDSTAPCAREIVEEAGNLVRAAHSTAEASLKTLRALIGPLASIEGPKTVILVSEGLVVDRQGDMLSWVSEETARAHASVYGIRLIPPVFDASDRWQRYSAELGQDAAARGMDMLVGRARGASFAVATRGERVFDRLALEMSGYYLLGFQPEGDDRNGRAHAIAVQVSRPGLFVRARRQFVAPPAPATTRDGVR
jgi:VWFA-related protein